MEKNTHDEDFSWLHSYAIFDRGPLTDYKHSAGLQGLEVTIDDCIEEARFRVDSIVTAVAGGHAADIAAQARILKSMSESCGLLRFAEITRVLESAASIRPAQDLDPMVREMSQIMMFSLAELEKFAGQIGVTIKTGIGGTR